MRQPVPFGKYLLLDRISVGGMAEVFKAKSYGVEGFEKIIAIKRILPTMGEDRDFIKMFIDEAKIAGQLAHANICQIFELGRIDGSHFIAMEYIWGKDLLQIQNRLRKIKQPMPIAMACFSIAKVLEGLDYAHRKRDPLGRPLEIVHRDCSPQNVLVSYEGEVKVIDFGIAKATSRNSRTMAGVLKGKFGYMSPEQVRGLPLDRRSDIFALGTMLYECLTGDRLFQGETDFSTLEKVRNVDIRPPRELNPNIPPDVEAVILKALAKDVEERYQWCSEMLADLQAFLMGQDVVFTAKSLSSWLKEVFSTEIDRERQQLEHYKRVGRDGLISGVPAAEHKGDVIEGLGEAGPIEGDPTVLGGPSFEDMEQAASAPAEVGPAPGSPAAVGAGAAEPPGDDDDDGEAFGEEAPTEIFGEINHGANPALPMPGPRASTGSQSPLTRPPKPPPSGRPPTARGDAASPVAAMQPGSGPASAPVAPRAGPGAPTFVQLAQPSAPQPAMGAQGFPGTAPPYQPYVQPPGYPMQSPSAMGPSEPGVGPGTPSAGLNGMPPPGTAAPGHGRTLLGTNPAAGAPAYPQGGPYAPYPGAPMHPNMQHGGHGQGQGPMQGQGSGQGMMPPPQGSPMHGYPQAQYPQPQGQYPQAQYPQAQYPQGQYPQAQYPQAQYPQAQAQAQAQAQGPSGPWQPNPYDSNPYAAPSGPYGQQPYNPGAPPVEQVAASDSKRRSSIARDVAIGVAIAAAVLGGFLIVKFLLFEDSSSEPAAPTSSIATIRLAMTPGVSADLFVDDKKIATVSDKQEIPVSAGQRKVKLVGPTGARCEQPMNLAAGKTTTLECAMTAGPSSGPGPSASPGASDPAPAAAGSGSSAPSGPSAGGAAGSGSSDARPPGTATDHLIPDKADKMPAEEPSRAGKPADRTDKPADKTGDAPRPAAVTADKSASSAAGHASPKPVEKPAKPSDVDDDLGKLQGGTKPGERRAAEARKPIPDDAARGYLAVTSKSPARIAVDGVDTGLSTPITGHMLPLPAGKHKVTFTVGGDRVVTFPVVIKAGENTALHKDL